MIHPNHKNNPNLKKLNTWTHQHLFRMFKFQAQTNQSKKRFKPQHLQIYFSNQYSKLLSLRRRFKSINLRNKSCLRLFQRVKKRNQTKTTPYKTSILRFTSSTIHTTAINQIFQLKKAQSIIFFRICKWARQIHSTILIKKNRLLSILLQITNPRRIRMIYFQC